MSYRRSIRALVREDGTLILPPYIDFREEGAVAPWAKTTADKKIRREPNVFEFPAAARVSMMETDFSVYREELNQLHKNEATTRLFFTLLGLVLIWVVFGLAVFGFIQW